MSRTSGTAQEAPHVPTPRDVAGVYILFSRHVRSQISGPELTDKKTRLGLLIQFVKAVMAPTWASRRKRHEAFRGTDRDARDAASRVWSVMKFVHGKYVGHENTSFIKDAEDSFLFPCFPNMVS